MLNNPAISKEDMETGKYVNTDCMKKFDYLDFVIMDVDSQYLPWMSKMRDLMMLFRMCKAVNKPILSMGLGMAQLSFYCAT